MMRFNTFTPFQIAIKAPDGERLFVLRRHPDLLDSKVGITDSDGLLWLAFNERKKSYGSGPLIEIVDRYENIKYTLTNADNNYFMMENNTEVGKIIHKVMKTPKHNILMIDNYLIEVAPNIPLDSPVRLLLLLSSVCLDILYFDGIDIR